MSLLLMRWLRDRRRSQIPRLRIVPAPQKERRIQEMRDYFEEIPSEPVGPILSAFRDSRLTSVEGLTRNKTLSDRQRAAANTSARNAPAPANGPHVAAAIEKGVSTFMETTPALIKTLDEVAKVHQFISGMDGSALKILCVENFTSSYSRI